MRREPTRVESMLRILCAALMLSLGFAHKPVLASPVIMLDETYRLPDGTFAEICSEHLSGAPFSHREQKHPQEATLFCEACLLASSILLPVPDDGKWLRTHSAWLENAPAQKRGVLRLALLRTNHARGPPAFTF